MDALIENQHLLFSNEAELKSHERMTNPNFVNRYNPEVLRKNLEEAASKREAPQYDTEKYERDNFGILREKKSKQNSDHIPKLTEEQQKAIFGKALYEQLQKQAELNREKADDVKADELEETFVIEENEEILQSVANANDNLLEDDLGLDALFGEENQQPESKADELEEPFVIEENEEIPQLVEDANDGLLEDDLGLDILFAEENQMNGIEAANNDQNLKESIVEIPTVINDSANVTVFINQLNTFNGMFRTDVDANTFAFYVTEAWALMKNGDEQKKAEGQKMLSDLFKDTLKQAFEIEKGVSYDEHRLPEYTEIIKSSNELLRAAMFAVTDLYHDPNSAPLFDATAFGGLNAKEMAELTAGDSLWSMDQKSDAAWEIQSQEAKNIADKWLGENKPYETMINEMNALVESNKNSIVDRKEILNKLAAAEWLLMNNEKMMIENPEDPINPIPNWGNRYWKVLTQTREALGIDKHTSMRELIQGDYAASAKAVSNPTYNEIQIEDYVLDPDARGIYDSMDLQKEQFATHSAAVVLNDPKEEKKVDEFEMTSERMQFTVKSEDQREIMKNEPKSYHFIIERSAEVSLNGPTQNAKV